MRDVQVREVQQFFQILNTMLESGALFVFRNSDPGECEWGPQMILEILAGLEGNEAILQREVTPIMRDLSRADREAVLAYSQFPVETVKDLLALVPRKGSSISMPIFSHFAITFWGTSFFRFMCKEMLSERGDDRPCLSRVVASGEAAFVAALAVVLVAQLSPGMVARNVFPLMQIPLNASWKEIAISMDESGKWSISIIPTDSETAVSAPGSG